MMEHFLISALSQGGYLAISVALLYFLVKLEKRIEHLEKKLEYFYSNYVAKEDYYRDISGWRGEINRLEDKIDRLIEKKL